MKRAIFITSILILSCVAMGATNLSGQDGKKILAGLQPGTLEIQNSSDLWSWGSAPTGHIINNSSLVEGAWILPVDLSSMESPSMAVPQNLAPGETNNVKSISPTYQQTDSKGVGSNVKGGFDSTGLKQPGEAGATNTQY